MLMDPTHTQPESPFPSDATNLNPDFFFPSNFLEPTTPETFLELDPANFFSHGSATKGSCASVFTRAPSIQQTTPINCWAKMEPSREPCTDEIPWSDLVFWLGNTSTGEVSCSCVQCTHRAMRACNVGLLRQHRYSPYQQQQHQQQQQRRRVSSRVPVINLPRIEGLSFAR